MQTRDVTSPLHVPTKISPLHVVPTRRRGSRTSVAASLRASKGRHRPNGHDAVEMAGLLRTPLLPL